MIDTIVFDFGGVLIDWNPKYVYREIFNDDEKMDWFLANICTNEWNLEQDRGRSFAEGTGMLKEIYPEYKEHIDAYFNQWPKMLKGEIAETVTILKKLKERFKVYGLTNWSAETFPVALEQFSFLQLFDGIVVSGVEKMIKPGKEIFELLLNRYDLKAEHCVFIDDNELNIATANKLGFHAIHFTSAATLEKELIALGVTD